MLDNHYVHPRLTALYDLDSPWSEDRQYYLDLAGREPRAVMDMGCGTGLICNEYAAKGHDVTGVDPAAAMLDIARRKPYGHLIKWIVSTAQDFKSPVRFDLIIMTGHAFQVLLEDDQIHAALSAIREHLKLHGRFAFESRNPDWDWSNQWRYDMALEHPDGTVYETREILEHKGDRMRFALSYKFSDETLMSYSELRFLSHKDIESHLESAGLKIQKFSGDWDGSAFDATKSSEMIYIATR